MNASVLALRPRHGRLRESAYLGASIGASIVVAVLAVEGTWVRLALVLTVCLAFIGFGFSSPQTMFFLVVAWLAALGLLRRLVTLDAGGVSKDPLLLVEPVAFVILVLICARAGAFRRTTVLSKWVLVLSGLAILGAFNPVQGSIGTGLAGLLFLLVPMLAFWVGRVLVDDLTLSRVLKLVAGLALASAVYGLWQTLHGFPAWDEKWIAQSGFLALNVDKTIRPFSTFSSPAEFGFYLAIGIAVWIAFARSPVRMAFALGAVALLGTALMYEASRTVVVLLVVALGISLAANRGLRLPVAFGVGALAIVTLSFLAGHFAARGTASTSSALVAHEAQGLASPFSSKSSTAMGHISLVIDGIRSTLANPAGRGVGSVTMASSKFGGQHWNTEADPSNVGVALGLPGLLAYSVVLFTGLALMYRKVVERRDALSTAALAVVLATVLEWLNGGQYAVAFLPWLILGWADGGELYKARDGFRGSGAHPASGGTTERGG